MTHHIFITKTGVTIAATGLLNLGAMIAREDISTYLQFGTMLGLIYLGFVSAKTAKTTNQIHVLSNSNMEAQLRIVMLQAKRISEMTKAKPDIDIANEAERAYEEHKAKQAVVDSGEKT